MKTAATVLLILAVYVLAAWIDNPPRRDAILKRVRDVQTSCDLFATGDQMAALMLQKKAPV